MRIEKMFSSVQRTVLPFFTQSMFNLFKNFTTKPLNDNLSQRNRETNQSTLDQQEEVISNPNNNEDNNQLVIDNNQNTNINNNQMQNSSQHSHRSSSPTIFNLLQDQVMSFY